MSKRFAVIASLVGSIIGICALSAKNTKKKIDKEVELKLKHAFPNEEKTDHDA